jgi:hypothetical protein
MDRSAIIRDIYIKMDEILPPGESMSHPFDSYINSILDESYRQVLKECPVSLLPLSEIEEVRFYDTTNEKAYVLVPEDFVKLGIFKFSDWSNPATKHITVDSPEYKLIETGVLPGGTVKPIVVLTHAKLPTIEAEGEDPGFTGDTTPQRYLVCYKVSTNDSAESLLYVQYDKDDGITSLNEDVIGGMTWLAASKLMQIFEMQGVKFAEERYQNFLLRNI